MDWQYLVVYVIVAAAFYGLYQRFVRIARPPARKPGGGCNSCGPVCESKAPPKPR